MTSVRALVSALVVATTAGCDPGLDGRDAARLLEEHIHELAPLTSDSDHLVVVPEAVLELGEVEREARLRVVRSGEREDGSTASDTSEVLTAQYRRSDQGWLLTRYGPELAHVVAIAIYRERSLMYSDLLEQLSILSAINRAWHREMGRLRTAAASREDYQRYLRLGEQQKVGPNLDEFRALMAADTATLSPGVTWQYHPGIADIGDAVYWVSPSDSVGVACGELGTHVGEGRPASLEHRWVDDSSPRCRGRGGNFSPTRTYDEVLVEIESSGGILLP